MNKVILFADGYVGEQILKGFIGKPNLPIAVILGLTPPNSKKNLIEEAAREALIPAYYWYNIKSELNRNILSDLEPDCWFRRIDISWEDTGEPASFLDLDSVVSIRKLLNLLRARTYEGFPGCKFRDGEKIYEVTVKIKEVKS